LQALAEHGFLPVAEDDHEPRYIDEHGHMFVQRQLVEESAESIADLIRHLHHEE
jgi:hypothetical protein